MTVSTFEEITTSQPEKVGGTFKEKAGRNNYGRITLDIVGRTQRLYRKIDFKRDKDGIPAKVASIE